MIDNYMKKIKNMLIDKRNKKYIVTGVIMLFTICFFTFDLGGLLNRLFTSISNLFSNVDGEVKQVVIKGDGYDEEVGGSIQITKSADWIDSESATLVYEVKTSLEINDNVRDVVLVLDTSSSMGVSEIDQLKEDTKEFISFLLLNSNNRVGIVTFDDTAEILSPLSNDVVALFEKIDNITTGEDRSYYKALVKVEELLRDYQVVDNRELIILFVATGYSNVDSPNEIGQYQILKGKYPNSVIYGIDYEIGSVFLDFLVPISDIQIGMDGKRNPLLEPGLNPEYYETFEIIEYINNNYFYVDNTDDIKVSVGSVEIQKEDNQQKIIWTANKNLLRTGNNATMEINIKLNDKLIKVEGLYPTSSKTSINYNLFDNSKVSEESSETPILKNGYRIKYNPNLPKG